MFANRLIGVLGTAYWQTPWKKKAFMQMPENGTNVHTYLVIHVQNALTEFPIRRVELPPHCV